MSSAVATSSISSPTTSRRMPLADAASQQSNDDNVVDEQQQPKSSNNNNKKRKTVYRCDVCQKRTFECFDEACRHEEECRRAEQEREEDTSSSSSSVVLDADAEEESPSKKQKTGDAAAAAAVLAAAALLDEDSKAKASSSNAGGGGNWLSAASTKEKKKAAPTTKRTKTTTTTTRKRTTRKAKDDNNNDVVETSIDDQKKSSKAAATATKRTKKKKPAPPAPATMNAFFSASTYTSNNKASASASSSSSSNGNSSASSKIKKATTGSSSSSTIAKEAKEETVEPKAAAADSKTTTATATTKKTETTTAPKQKSKAAKTKSKKVVDTPFAPLFLEGADHDALLAEHRAAEFQAKRRLAQQQERERQAKRQKAFGLVAQQQQQPKPQFGTVKKNKPKSLLPACRFPNPTHVFPATDSSTGSDLPSPCVHWWTEEMRLQAQAALQQAWFRGSEKPPLVVEDATTTTDTSSLRLRPDSSSELDVLPALDETFPFQTLVSFLDPPSSAESSSSTTVDNTLWTDKYSLASSSSSSDTSSDSNEERRGRRPCGASLQHAFSTLKQLVDDWKVERQRANERMAERQRALARKNSGKRTKKKAAKKKAQTHDDYDEWLDSDVEHEEDDGLSSLCLITGPVASGKSSLVHAVARDADCNVLEINTLQKRGAAALRKVLEEATQSHSSLDMLKKKQASIFASLSQQQEKEELVDTDDEKDESSTTDAAAKGSHVTIVLLDEVDLLYEDDGGFWTALSDVMKRAKSPIILTANRIPEEMQSSVYRNCRHIAVERPTPDECVSFLRHILESEGFSLRSGMEEQLDRELSRLAEFYNSDLRRLCHELQLMLLPGSQQRSSSPKVNNDSTVQSTFPEICQEVQEEERTLSLPTLESIKPLSVPPSQFSLVTISGSGFLSLVPSTSKPTTTTSKSGYPVSVEVGSQLCPDARIMDDSTILAVVPPRQSRPDVDAKGNFCRTNIQCLSACYAPVHVHGVDKMGLLSSTKGMVTTMELVDGTKLASLNPAVTLEYTNQPTLEYFMARQQSQAAAASSNKKLDGEDKDGGSDSEAEFEGATSTAAATAPNAPPAVSTSSGDKQKTIAALMEDGIKAWISRYGNTAKLPSSEATVSNRKDSVVVTNDLDSLYNMAHLASDAAFLEDGASAGIPHLSGAVPGFGFDLTDAYPKCNNQKSKSPSEESLFASGWKDDAFFYGCGNTYVCRPASRRERRIMLRSEGTLRGQALQRHESQQDDDDEGDVIFWENSEEDMYLVNSVPHSLSLLPCYLRKAAAAKTGAIGATLISQDPLFDRKKLATLERGIDMLEKCDHRYDPWLRLFAPIMSRQLDPMLDVTESIDGPVFLEYLPLLRCMAVRERAAQAASLLEEDPLSQGSSQGSSRVTRRSKKRGHVHYFEKAFDGFNTTGVENAEVKAVGEQFASAHLQKE